MPPPIAVVGASWSSPVRPASEVTARLGVRKVHRRARKEGLLAPRPLFVVRRRRGLREPAEVIRQRLGIAEDDLPENASAKVSEGLEAFVDDPDERAYIAQRVNRLLGVPGGEAGAVALDRDELFAGWRLFFERLASRQPVTILVEDAQYADEGLIEFVNHLVDWARDTPIFVLVFARPEIEDTRPGFGVGRNRTTLALDPLDRRSMDSLLDALVPGLSDSARERISAQSQGIPLFAVETIRTLIDRDVVVPLEGEYRLVGDVGDLSVPDSLHGLLAARLDALDHELRGLVADASVLGGAFSAEALVAVSGRPVDKVEAGLRELVRREVLHVSSDPLSPEQGSYQFSQNMLRRSRTQPVQTRSQAAAPGGGVAPSGCLRRRRRGGC